MKGPCFNITFFIPLIMVCGWLFSISHEKQSIKHISFDRTEKHCSDSLILSDFYKREINGTKIVNSSIDFQGVSVIKSLVCSAGTLVIDAEGQTAAGEEPNLRIGLGDKVIAEKSFGKREVWKTMITHPDELSLSYLNDYYASEVRLAILEQIKFYGKNCSTIKIEVPSGVGGEWIPLLGYLSIVWNVPVIIEPCSQGVLEFQTHGIEAGGKLPVLQLTQTTYKPVKLYLSYKRKLEKINITEKMVQVLIVNPYAKVNGDRNLSVHTIKFYPVKK
jgi:hypothetical protein